MSDIPMKRGERMARWMIQRLVEGGVTAEPFKGPDGWGLRFEGYESHTPEQLDLAVDAVMFGIGYPRNFATMCRILQAKEATQ